MSSKKISEVSVKSRLTGSEKIPISDGSGIPKATEVSSIGCLDVSGLFAGKRMKTTIEVLLRSRLYASVNLSDFVSWRNKTMIAPCDLIVFYSPDNNYEYGLQVTVVDADQSCESKFILCVVKDGEYVKGTYRYVATVNDEESDGDNVSHTTKGEITSWTDEDSSSDSGGSSSGGSSSEPQSWNLTQQSVCESFINTYVTNDSTRNWGYADETRNNYTTLRVKGLATPSLINSSGDSINSVTTTIILTLKANTTYKIGYTLSSEGGYDKGYIQGELLNDPNVTSSIVSNVSGTINVVSNGSGEIEVNYVKDTSKAMGADSLWLTSIEEVV